MLIKRLGIERQTVVNIAKENNIPLKEEDFTLEFFLSADEWFMSRYIQKSEKRKIRKIENGET